MPLSKIRKRTCKNCGTIFTLGVESTLHKYCSIKCRSAFHNAHSGRKYRNSAKGKQAMRARRLQKEFVLTVEEYNHIFAAQNYKCAICKTSTPTGYNWHIDHWHTTNRIRGLLCSKCNQGLGLFNDSIDNLKEAVKYLEN